MGNWWPERRAGDLVGYLDEDEHQRLLAATEGATAAPGDLILRKGDASMSLLLVEEGDVEVVDESLGETVVLAAIGPGGIVGEVGFVDGRPRTHSVRARAACRLRRLSRERLLELVRHDAPLFAKLTLALAEILAARFRAALNELAPFQAFAASLGEPLEPEEEGFDEVDEPLPEEALELIRNLGRRVKEQKDLTGL